MDKETLLGEIKSALASGLLSHADVHALLSRKEGGVGQNESTSEHPIAKMLYAIGGIIVLVGIVTFMVEIWDTLTSALRIIATLGLGVVCIALGTVLWRRVARSIGLVFHVLAAFLIPYGTGIYMHEMNIVLTEGRLALIALALTALYGVFVYALRHVFFIFLTTLFGSVALYESMLAVLEHFALFNSNHLVAYFVLLMGLGHLLLARAYTKFSVGRLVPFLYIVGAIEVFSDGFTRLLNTKSWELLFIALLIGGFLLSVAWRSRALLISSAVFLVGYISYITSEYFVDSLGWPLALIFIGLVIVGSGYGAFVVNKKYIARAGV